ncbi:hypothetical protein FJT64_025094 [Amphibalanus amphitrite]|uniref:Uncharacterized protein n=1 Tax=Amphibalanus amphitrite TaxID=1232801 RepID=A0A6A4W8K1_AMPAM|nr:hypothetical protein FJT64_025094 [Amphibalanus amphitrite]
MSSISKDLHEFREIVAAEISALNDRVRDLERHVEERDNEVADLTRDLAAARSDIKALQERTENAEMNSRIPCLILSGGAMASRRKAVLGAPLPVDGVRDQLMSRRLELKGQDLFINESLTAGKSQIYRSLLEAKKTQMIYTVFTRWGHVFFKSEKFGTSTRVDSIEKLRELRFPVKQ